MTRPTSDEVAAYRAHVDAAVSSLAPDDPEIAEIVEIGLNHEQQHQELLITGYPARLRVQSDASRLRSRMAPPAPSRTRGEVDLEAGIRRVGHDGRGFSFDNEGPRHERR